MKPRVPASIRFSRGRGTGRDPRDRDRASREWSGRPGAREVGNGLGVGVGDLVQRRETGLAGECVHCGCGNVPGTCREGAGVLTSTKTKQGMMEKLLFR